MAYCFGNILHNSDAVDDGKPVFSYLKLFSFYLSVLLTLLYASKIHKLDVTKKWSLLLFFQAIMMEY